LERHRAVLGQGEILPVVDFGGPGWRGYPEQEGTDGELGYGTHTGSFLAVCTAQQKSTDLWNSTTNTVQTMTKG
jgi:hypothetical protein